MCGSAKCDQQVKKNQLERRFVLHCMTYDILWFQHFYMYVHVNVRIWRITKNWKGNWTTSKVLFRNLALFSACLSGESLKFLCWTLQRVFQVGTNEQCIFFIFRPPQIFHLQSLYLGLLLWEIFWEHFTVRKHFSCYSLGEFFNVLLRTLQKMVPLSVRVLRMLSYQSQCSI